MSAVLGGGAVGAVVSGFVGSVGDRSGVGVAVGGLGSGVGMLVGGGRCMCRSNKSL